MEQSRNSVTRLNNAVEELITIVLQQREDFNTRFILEKNRADSATNKAALLEAQLESLKGEREKLKIDLIAAQNKNNSEAEDKLNTLQNELDSKSSKINGLQTEIHNLNTALTNRKAQIEELNNKVNDLSQQLAAANLKVSEIENNAAGKDDSFAELQHRLDEALSVNEELQKQCDEREERLQQMQYTISQTTENIDDVVAKLERVLQENGAGNNND